MVVASRRRAQRAEAKQPPRRCGRSLFSLFSIAAPTASGFRDDLHTWRDASHPYRNPKVLRSADPQIVPPICLGLSVAAPLDIQQKPLPQTAFVLANGSGHCSVPGAPASRWDKSGLHSAIAIPSNDKLLPAVAASILRAVVFGCKCFSTDLSAVAGSANSAKWVSSSRL